MAAALCSAGAYSEKGGNPVARPPHLGADSLLEDVSAGHAGGGAPLCMDHATPATCRMPPQDGPREAPTCLLPTTICTAC